MICNKRKNNYNATITWIQRKIAFPLIELEYAYVEAADLLMLLSGDAYCTQLNFNGAYRSTR